MLMGAQDVVQSSLMLHLHVLILSSLLCPQHQPCLQCIDWNEDDHTAMDGSDDDGESEEEIYAADVNAPKPGEPQLTPEARVFQAVSGMLFNAQADVVEEQLHRKGPTADRLLRHVDTLQSCRVRRPRGAVAIGWPPPYMEPRARGSPVRPRTAGNPVYVLSAVPATLASLSRAYSRPSFLKVSPMTHLVARWQQAQGKASSLSHSLHLPRWPYLT